MKLQLFAAAAALLMTSSASPLSAADEAKVSASNAGVAVVGGGCFWCVEGAYKIVPGITKVVSGYAGGAKADPSYKEVCAGTTGHAEVCEVHFDKSKLSYKDVLDLFFLLHDPTTLNRQGHDEGTQYRSIVLYGTDEEKKIAEQAKADAKSHWPDAIVTEIVPLTKFYAAEDYHQDYFAKNPLAGYCQAVVGPKIKKFREKLEARQNGAK